MANEVSSADELKKQLEKEGQVINHINVLFLDVSSACVGYSIFQLSFVDKTSKMTKAGCLWLDPNWEHPEKYSYVFNAIQNYFWTVEQIDFIVVEQYSINPKKMVGVAVVPEMMGVIKCAANENGVKVSSILPQTWRSVLGIKPDVTLDKNGKKSRDFKDPAKRYVDNLLPTPIPANVVSNITKNSRQTPSDLFDAICVGLAWVKKLGFVSTDVTSVKINDHIGQQ